MIKKKILTGLAVLSVVALPFSAFAATSDSSIGKGVRSFFHYDMTKLSDTQKSDIKLYEQKAADLQKEFINKMLADGAITQEQATEQLNDVDAKLKSGKPSGFFRGLACGRGEHPGGKGGREASFLKGIDLSKLSEQQKADLVATVNQMLSQEQADEKNTTLDQVAGEIGKLETNHVVSADQATAITK